MERPSPISARPGPVVPGPRSELRIEEVRSAAALAELRTPWTELWRRAPGATPFSSPTWLLPWCRHLAPRPPRAVTAWRGRDLVCLAPAFVYEDARGRVLGLLGGGVSDYQDFLAEDAASAGVVLAHACEAGGIDA